MTDAQQPTPGQKAILAAAGFRFSRTHQAWFDGSASERPYALADALRLARKDLTPAVADLVVVMIDGSTGA